MAKKITAQQKQLETILVETLEKYVSIKTEYNNLSNHNGKRYWELLTEKVNITQAVVEAGLNFIETAEHSSKAKNEIEFLRNTAKKNMVRCTQLAEYFLSIIKIS